MNTFDQIARQLCKQDGAACFQWVLRDRPDCQLGFRTWDDARRLPLPGQPDRTNDLVAIFDAPAPNQTALGLVEVQVEADWAIFPRLGIVELLAVQERASREDSNPWVFTVLLNLTGENPEAGWQSPLGGTSVRPVVLNLRNRSCESLLDAIEQDQLSPMLLPWVTLHQDGGESATLERWLQLIGKETSAERRGMIREFTLIFAELSKKLVRWQKSLEEAKMLESQIVLGWMKRGRDEGVVVNAREFLSECIRTRLANPIPEDLALAIEGTNDDQILGRWFKFALQAQDISELRKAMKTA